MSTADTTTMNTPVTADWLRAAGWGQITARLWASPDGQLQLLALEDGEWECWCAGEYHCRLHYAGELPVEPVPPLESGARLVAVLLLLLLGGLCGGLAGGLWLR